MWTLVYALVIITSPVLTSGECSLDTVYKWKYVDYTWESEGKRQRAIDSGKYNYTQVIPMDVDVAPDGRVFVTMIGMKGVPAVLATVTNQMKPNGPLVRPYPDWSYFRTGDCNSITNVYRVAIDECERLWVLDVGYLDEEPITCEPQLLAFDLKTDRLIQRIKIPDHIARGKNGQTLLATPIVETNGRRCENTTVYMADVYGFGLVIWNNGNLSRLDNPVFEASKDAGNLTAGNYTAHWPDAGIVTMAISPIITPGEQTSLYFHALASFDLHAANITALKRGTDGSDVEFITAKNILNSQAVGMAFSAEGTLFIALTKESAIVCWNKYKELESQNFETIAQDNDRLQYVNGIKIIRGSSPNDQEIWTLSNRLVTVEYDKLNFNDYNFYVLKSSVNKLIAAFALGKLDFSDYNYPVLKGSVSELVAGTVCEK